MRVLDSCQQALKETTDICFEYERGKVGNGGKWLTIVFTIIKNEPTNAQMTLFELGVGNYIDLNDFKQEAKPDFDKSDPYSSNIDFYMEACNNEFTVSEIESLLSIISTMDLPEHRLGSQFSKYHYLQEQYTYFNAISKQQTILNRFNYFRAIIKAERDKQRGTMNNE